MDDPRQRRSMLWVFVMFNMLAADVISFLDGAFLRGLLEGRAGDVEISGAFLLAAAIMIEIPISMIVLSRVLAGRWDRIANVVAAAFTAAFVMFGGSGSLHYVFFASVEIAALGLIAWSAWAPRQRPAQEPAEGPDRQAVPA